MHNAYAGVLCVSLYDSTIPYELIYYIFGILFNKNFYKINTNTIKKTKKKTHLLSKISNHKPD